MLDLILRFGIPAESGLDFGLLCPITNMLRFPPKYLILRFDILMQAGLNFNSFCRIKKTWNFPNNLCWFITPTTMVYDTYNWLMGVINQFIDFEVCHFDAEQGWPVLGQAKRRPG